MDASGYDKVSVGDLCTQYSAKAIPGQMDFSKVQDKLKETVGGYVEKEWIRGIYSVSRISFLP